MHRNQTSCRLPTSYCNHDLDNDLDNDVVSIDSQMNSMGDDDNNDVEDDD